ncbi:MAG: c-type cytochrome [Proteobacteria bacterium]|nr:c-type cytochrome [Pseudomonadota bacterium]
MLLPVAGLATIPGAVADPVPPQTTAFVEGSCALCHAVPGLPAEPRTTSCTDCHIWIKAVASDPRKREKAKEIFPLWERYEKNVHSYLEVPNLEAAMARLEPEWVRGYLQDPHDLRPNLDESMPRFALSEATLDSIEQAFEQARVDVEPTPKPRRKNVEAGEALFTSAGCAACHSLGPHHTSVSLPMAPDLAHTRARMDPDVAVAWIANPKAVSEHATMPALGLDQDQAVLLRDYIWLARLDWESSQVTQAVIEPTTQPVTWEDVESRVFGRICAHCHMNPELNQGRAGPGNAGGFGYAPTGIELETYEGVVAAIDAIPDALQRRRDEADRDWVKPGSAPRVLTRPDQPGMPLGHPPIPDEDISLVLGWIDQGMPR